MRRGFDRLAAQGNERAFALHALVVAEITPVRGRGSM